MPTILSVQKLGYILFFTDVFSGANYIVTTDNAHAVTFGCILSYNPMYLFGNVEFTIDSILNLVF